MRVWAFLFGGMILWAVHFFALYAIASVFLTTPLARALTLAVTAICMGAAVWLLALARRRRATGTFDGWIGSVATLFAGGAMVAIVWQALPALFVIG